MKRILSLSISTLFATNIIIAGIFTAYASDTLDALHNGQPPILPPVAATAAPTAFTTLPSLNATTTTTPDITGEAEISLAPVAPPTSASPALYPVDVVGVEENGVQWIVKTYELSEEEKPDWIPNDGFERGGWQYNLTDIVRKETTATDTREHIETITVNTDTKNADAVIKHLEPTLEYESDDGYIGTLTLDITTIKTETAGTKSSSYTVSATREYPHLSANDTSLIPKTITENGKMLTLQGVNWRTDRIVAVDYNELPYSYTAVATYTATGSKSVVTGYITTAEYKGTIAKLIEGKPIYTAYFAGAEIVPPTPEPTATPKPTPKPTPVPTPTPLPEPTSPIPAIAGTTGRAGLLGGVVFFFFFRRNVKVHNLKDEKYMPIGKTRVTARNPIINLTPFADKAATGSFILVLDKPAAKSMSGKTVTINYGDKSFQHIIDSDSGEYQFSVDF